MNTYEWIKLGMLILLGVSASYSDIKEGVIPNRLLILFAVIGVFLDVFYIIFVAQDILLLTIGNILTSVLVAFLLYWTHAFAGGDLKLVATMSLLYPTGAYLTYGISDVTLFLAIFFAVFWGYVYLLADTLFYIGKGNVGFNQKYVRSYLTHYMKTYISAMSYVSLLMLLSEIVRRYILQVPSAITWAGGFAIAWLCGRYPALRQKQFVGAVLALDFIIGWILKIFPFSRNPCTYVFTAVLVLCQMAIRSNLYREIPTSEVRKGMILSMASSLSMQRAKVHGLPGISSEDLRDRLTEEQAESIKKWGKTKSGLDRLMIIRKIPFAIFITFGYITYFSLWGVLTQ